MTSLAADNNETQLSDWSNTNLHSQLLAQAVIFGLTSTHLRFKINWTSPEIQLFSTSLKVNAHKKYDSVPWNIF